MELVYLWVEEYKNIKQQGFNFSPRFTCKYDKDKNELAIEEKKDYISIFPENINVTAIVGKNGSGKSSICKEILNVVSGKILVFKIQNTFFVQVPDNIITHFPYKSLKPNLELFNIIYLHTDIIKFEPVLDSYAYINLGTTFANPYYNILKYDDDRCEIEGTANLLDLDNFSRKLYLLILKYFDQFDHIFTFKPSKVTLLARIRLKEDTLENELLEYIKKNKRSKLDNINEYINCLKELQPFITEGETNQAKELSEIISAHNNAFSVLSNIGFIKVDFIDDIGRKFFELSHGERKNFIDSLLLYDEIIKGNRNHFLILLDEPDIALHPEWQKKYIDNLLTLMQSFPSKKFHLVIASHSPFILSDIPSQNIIFLDRDNEGNCKVLDGLRSKKQTFGANIHTLLSDAFFMEDGLMGEFAKSKINEVIDYLNGKKSPITDDDEAQRYIRIIGEPIVKRQLQRMLDSKKLDKIKEIDELKNQIESLQNRLENLENKS